MDLNEIRPASSGNTMPPPPLEKHRPWKTITIIVIAVAVIAVLTMMLQKTTTGPDGYDEAGNPVYRAQEGELIAGFPKELLLEQDGVILDSARIDYTAQGISLPSARYLSRQSYSQNIDGYRRLLLEQGWVVQKDAFYEEMPLTSFYATRNETETVNIILTPSNDGIMVSVTYAVANQ